MSTYARKDTDARGPAPVWVETREQFDEAVGELLRTGRPIEAPSLDALAAWNVDLEDEKALSRSSGDGET